MVSPLKVIKLSPPEVRNSDARLVAKAIKQKQLSQGEYLSQFERELRTLTGSSNALTVSSCTTGLQLILAALNLSSGDEVIVPNFTFPATINSVIQEGLTPVLADIDLDTYCMSPKSFEEAITPKTKAVIVVHAFGYPAEMDAILKIANKFQIKVIEDAACAIGSQIDGKAVGTFGIASSFSFHPRKVITTGEGGAVLTDDVELSEQMKILRTHGGVRGDAYLSFVMPGFNYRMSDINAALGISQLKRIDQILKSRRKIAEQYSNLLSDIDGLEIPKLKPGYVHTFQSFVLRLPTSVDRDSVIFGLRELGIETTLGTYALSIQPAYEKIAIQKVSLNNSELAHSKTLALPMSSKITKKQVVMVCRALREQISKQVD